MEGRVWNRGDVPRFLELAAEEPERFCRLRQIYEMEEIQAEDAGNG